MSHDPDIITKIAASIAPKIKGQDDIKMAIACLLFGGSRKVGEMLLHCMCKGLQDTPTAKTMQHCLTCPRWQQVAAIQPAPARIQQSTTGQQ
jgi:hypothetical protein